MTEAQKALAPDKRSTFTVKEPFDSDPGADIILISCDNAEFRARKAILSFISPVFSDMFSLPHAITDEVGERPETINNLPFVHLSENGAVIDTLLRYGYPLINPLTTDSYLLFDVLSAAEKYDMKYAMSGIEAALTLMRHSKPEVLLFLYRRSCNLHMGKEARQHAFDCLKLSHQSIVKHWGPNTSVGALSNLIDYHQAVCMAVINFINKSPLSGPGLSGKRITDVFGHVSGLQLDWPMWWTTGLVSGVQNILKDGPLSARILLEEEILALVKPPGSHSNEMKEFESKLSLAITDEAKQIKLVLPW